MFFRNALQGLAVVKRGQWVCEHQNVRGGHLDRDSTLANPLQQVLVLELLVAPFATLDNELPPNK